jgi:hypothetical protein
MDTQIDFTNINLLDVLNKILKTMTIKELAVLLNVAAGTITRWIELNNIPKNYEFDLLKLLNIKIDYSMYNSKQKDQFFTPVETAKVCFDVFCEEIQKYGDTQTDFTYIESSAGDGSFIKVLPAERTIAMDIEPMHATICEEDYLNWKPPTNEKTQDIKYVVMGNPPFGLRGHLALKFINHSYDFADYVCFILPQLFESDGKGVPRKRVKGYNLIYSKKLDTKFYEPDKNELNINTILQIWSKHHMNEEYELKEIIHEDMKIYSLSDGGTGSSTRNKNMIDCCDVYLPSTCFGKDNVKCYHGFVDLPGKKGYGIVFNKNKKDMIKRASTINWGEVAFLSTNSAYNLRTSQIYAALN